MSRILSFRFDTFGDVTTASSRLRAWKLSQFLKASGHRVTMNEGARCDVYVCQKVRPFASLRAMREAGALVVYDFDDHLLLEGVESHGVREEVVAFMNAADVVTVGSEYLGVDARNFHHNVFVLENPVDIESAKLVRGQKAELKRVGWFGTAAGLIDLRAVKTAEPIETITRGGDIEFDLKSIDRHAHRVRSAAASGRAEQMEFGQEREPDGEGSGARGPGARHRHAGAYRHRGGARSR